MNAEQTGRSRNYIDRIRHRLNDPDTRLGSLIVLGLGLIPLFMLFYVGWIMWETPDVDGLSRENFEQATVVYTHGGKEITRFYEKNRRWIPLDSIAEIVPKTLVAAEDQRYYQHQGVDVLRTGGAVFQTATGNKQGGSTITMQLVRNLYPDVGDDWDITRKFKEWFAALKMEDTYSKEKILELYLNTVPFGYNTYGIEAAAQTYFNAPAIKIDTLQAAQLIGLLKGTSYYDPVDHPERARERRNVVLEQLREEDIISDAAFQRLRDQPTELDFEPPTPSNNMAPFFATHVRKWLQKWAKQNGYNPFTDGLRVYTTLDAKQQQAAEQAVQEVLSELQNVVNVSWSQADVPFFSSNASAYASYAQQVEPFAYYWESHPNVLDQFIKESEAFKQRVKQGQSEEEALQALKQKEAFVDSVKHINTLLQGGFVAMEPQTGFVRAWVGGRDFETSQYDHVAQAKRQPGSTFKPFVYSAALEEGFRPNDMFRDEKITYTFPRTGKTWSPGNFGRETGALIPMREALAHSKNTVTSQLAIEIGPSRIADQARRMGITTEMDEVPSLALGTSPVTLLDMAAAYAVLANQGQYQKPVFLDRIENKDGRVLARFGPEGRRAISPSAAYGTLDMMRGVIDGGTGVRMRNQFGARGDLAGKTGTTQNNADGWFMLLHPRLVMGAWVGFNSPAVRFRTRYWGQGSHNALRIVGHFFNDVNLPAEAQFEAPGSYVEPSSGDSVGALRVFADGELRTEEEEAPDTLGLDDEEFDFDFTTEETGGEDVSETGTFRTDEVPADTAQQQEGLPEEGEEEQPEDEGTDAETEDLEEEPEPENEADQRTREAREESQVRELLERQENQNQEGGGEEGDNEEDDGNQ